MRASDHASAQLVELHESEALRAFYDNERSIFDVDSDLDDRCRDQNINLFILKIIHHFFFFCRAYFRVENFYLKLWENFFFQSFRFFFDRLGKYRKFFIWVRFIYAWTYHIELSSSFKLLADFLIRCKSFLRSDYFGNNFLPARWHFVEKR